MRSMAVSLHSRAACNREQSRLPQDSHSAEKSAANLAGFHAALFGRVSARACADSLIAPGRPIADAQADRFRRMRPSSCSARSSERPNGESPSPSGMRSRSFRAWASNSPSRRKLLRITRAIRCRNRRFPSHSDCMDMTCMLRLAFPIGSRCLHRPERHSRPRPGVPGRDQIRRRLLEHLPGEQDILLPFGVNAEQRGAGLEAPCDR